MRHISERSVLELYVNRSEWRLMRGFLFMGLFSGFLGFQILYWVDLSAEVADGVQYWFGVLSLLCFSGSLFYLPLHLIERGAQSKCVGIVSQSLCYFSISNALRQEVEKKLVSCAKQVLSLEKAGFPTQATTERDISFRPLFDSAKSLGILSDLESFDSYFKRAKRELEEEQVHKDKEGCGVSVGISPEGTVTPADVSGEGP